MADTEEPTSPRAHSGEPDGEVGRPAYVWDEQSLKALTMLAAARNTVGDMAIILGVSKRTLERLIAWDDNIERSEQHPCAVAYHGGVAHRCNLLRVEQLHVALARGMPGQKTMLVWLGKQDLGQRDVRPIEITGKDGERLAVDMDFMPALEKRLGEFLRNKQDRVAPEGVPVGKRDG